MANLNLVPAWPPIYQLELTDPVQAGPGGIDNLQAKQLGDRTEKLKEDVDPLVAYVAADRWQDAGVADVNGATAEPLFTFEFPLPGRNYVLEIELNANAQVGPVWAAVARVRTSGSASAGTVGPRWSMGTGGAYDLTYSLDTSNPASIVIKALRSVAGNASVLVRWRVVWVTEY